MTPPLRKLSIRFLLAASALLLLVQTSPVLAETCVAAGGAGCG